MDRRYFLAVCAAAGAGCAGGDGEEGATASETDINTVTSDNENAGGSEAGDNETAADPADFELVEYGFPDRVEIGESFTPSMTIQNTGGQAGDYEANLWASVADTDEWRSWNEWTWSSVPPGEESTIEASGPWGFEYLWELQIRLGEFDRTASLDVVTKQLAFGGTYTTPAGVQLTVQNVGLTEQYTYTDYDGETRPQDAPPEKQWAFVDLQAENTADTVSALPTKYDMVLLADNRQYEFATITDKEGEYEGGDVQPGVVEEGWLGFEIPAEVSTDSVAFVYNAVLSDGQIAARWG